MALSTTSHYPNQVNPINSIYVKSPHIRESEHEDKWEDSNYSGSSYSNSGGARTPHVMHNNIPGGPQKVRTHRVSQTRSKILFFKLTTF